MARKLLEAGYDLDIYDPQIEPDNLVGQNLGYAYAWLPKIDGLLVDKAQAESDDYDRVIATNRLVQDLNIDESKLVDVSTIP